MTSRRKYVVAALAAAVAGSVATAMTSGCNAQGGTSTYSVVGSMPEDNDPPPAMRSGTAVSAAPGTGPGATAAEGGGAGG